MSPRAMLRPHRIRPRPVVFYHAGPFVGMRDSLDPSAADPDKAFLLQNVYPIDPARRSAVIGRPGYQQFASLGAIKGQRAYQFTKLNGTEYSVVIAGGEIYTLNWTTRVATKVITTAQLTAATITLSATAKVYCTTFNDELIVSDGVNAPFAWDGTSGGGLTPLNNCPVLYGPPTVYYGKIFGIKSAERSTVVWSEENQANTGYEAGGYNNAWALGTTDQEPLFAVVGTNEALYVFRARSITAISGAVTPDFRTTGTREAVSESEGTTSPDSVEYHEQRIYFVDADYRHHMIVPGGGVVAMWQDFAETISSLDRTYIADAVSVYDPTSRLLLTALTEVGKSYPSVQFVLNPDLPNAYATALWRGFAMTSLDLLKNASGQPVLVHLTHDGYVYDHGLPGGTVWNDGTSPIQHVVEPAPLGYNHDVTQTFTRLDISFRAASALTGLRISHTTPRAVSTPLSATLTGALTLWDVATWDVSSWSATALEQHLAIGLNGEGRWMRPRIQHEALGEQFGMIGLKVSAVPNANDPAIP